MKSQKWPILLVRKSNRFAFNSVSVLTISTAAVRNAFWQVAIEWIYVRHGNNVSKLLHICFYLQFTLFLNDFNRRLKYWITSVLVISTGGVLQWAGMKLIKNLSIFWRTKVSYVLVDQIRTSQIVYWYYLWTCVDVVHIMWKQRYWNWVRKSTLLRHFSTLQSFGS